VYSDGSSYTQGAYNFPVLPNGLRGALSASSLSYHNVGDYRANGGYGEAVVLNASLAYPLVRSQEGNLNVTFGYDRKTFINRQLATDTISSSYRIKNIVAGVSGNNYDGLFGGAVNSGQLSLVTGKLELRDDNPPNFGLYTPAHFLKLAFAASRTQTLIPDRSSLVANVSGQLSSENLNSAEQFYLGGPYGIRAYPVAQAGGAQGMLGSFEYQHRLAEGWQGIAFFDAGRIQQYRNTYPGWQGNTNAGNVYNLYGAGIGARLNIAAVNFGFSVAWKVGRNPLYSQTGQQVDVDNTSHNPHAWLTASIKF
jgi:hemolysin activation/secretion protein